MKPVLALRAGATLLALLGLGRGLGGVSLLRSGADAAPLHAPPDVARLVGAGLILVGAIALVAAIGLFQKRIWGWPAALVALGLFFVGGVVNSTVHFGRPGLNGTVGNFLAAVFVGGVLALGRPALQGRPAVSQSAPVR